MQSGVGWDLGTKPLPRQGGTWHLPLCTDDEIAVVPEPASPLAVCVWRRVTAAGRAFEDWQAPWEQC